MARVLEGAQLRQDHTVAEVDVGARRVDAELDAQRTARRDLLGQASFGQRVDRAGGQPGEHIGRVRVRPCLRRPHLANARLAAGSEGVFTFVHAGGWGPRTAGAKRSAG